MKSLTSCRLLHPWLAGVVRGGAEQNQLGLLPAATCDVLMTIRLATQGRKSDHQRSCRKITIDLANKPWPRLHMAPPPPHYGANHIHLMILSIASKITVAPESPPFTDRVDLEGKMSVT